MFSDVLIQRTDCTLETIVVSSETIVIPSEARDLLGCVGDEASAPGARQTNRKAGLVDPASLRIPMKLDPYITNARASNSC